MIVRKNPGTCFDHAHVPKQKSEEDRLTQSCLMGKYIFNLCLDSEANTEARTINIAFRNLRAGHVGFFKS